MSGPSALLFASLSFLLRDVHAGPTQKEPPSPAPACTRLSARSLSAPDFGQFLEKRHFVETSGRISQVSDAKHANAVAAAAVEEIPKGQRWATVAELTEAVAKAEGEEFEHDQRWTTWRLDLLEDQRAWRVSLQQVNRELEVLLQQEGRLQAEAKTTESTIATLRKAIKDEDAEYRAQRRETLRELERLEWVVLVESEAVWGGDTNEQRTREVALRAARKHAEDHADSIGWFESTLVEDVRQVDDAREEAVTSANLSASVDAVWHSVKGSTLRSTRLSEPVAYGQFDCPAGLNPVCVRERRLHWIGVKPFLRAASAGVASVDEPDSLDASGIVVDQHTVTRHELESVREWLAEAQRRNAFERQTADSILKKHFGSISAVHSRLAEDRERLARAEMRLNQIPLDMKKVDAQIAALEAEIEVCKDGQRGAEARYDDSARVDSRIVPVRAEVDLSADAVQTVNDRLRKGLEGKISNALAQFRDEFRLTTAQWNLARDGQPTRREVQLGSEVRVTHFKTVGQLAQKTDADTEKATLLAVLRIELTRPDPPHPNPLSTATSASAPSPSGNQCNTPTVRRFLSDPDKVPPPELRPVLRTCLLADQDVALCSRSRCVSDGQTLFLFRGRVLWEEVEQLRDAGWHGLQWRLIDTKREGDALARIQRAECRSNDNPFCEGAAWLDRLDAYSYRTFNLSGFRPNGGSAETQRNQPRKLILVLQ